MTTSSPASWPQKRALRSYFVVQTGQIRAITPAGSAVPRARGPRGVVDGERDELVAVVRAAAEAGLVGAPARHADEAGAPAGAPTGAEAEVEHVLGWHEPARVARAVGHAVVLGSARRADHRARRGDREPAAAPPRTIAGRGRGRGITGGAVETGGNAAGCRAAAGCTRPRRRKTSASATSPRMTRPGARPPRSITAPRPRPPRVSMERIRTSTEEPSLRG